MNTVFKDLMEEMMKEMRRFPRFWLDAHGNQHGLLSLASS